MRLMWSRAKSLDPICFVLEEPVSHVAICFFDCIVFHSTFSGVDILSKQDFEANRDVVYILNFDLSDIDEQTLLVYLSSTQTHKKYDWPFFWWLFKHSIMSKMFKKGLPDKIESQSKSHILCTEIIELLPDELRPVYDSSKAVTPYQLYLLLENAVWPYSQT